jgi:hypothetical protein
MFFPTFSEEQSPEGRSEDLQPRQQCDWKLAAVAALGKVFWGWYWDGIGQLWSILCRGIRLCLQLHFSGERSHASNMAFAIGQN